MPTRVIKRDGQKEDFIPEKIVVSVLKAGASLEVARMMAVEVGKKAGDWMETKRIREIILEKLKELFPEAGENMAKYDKT